MAAWLEQYDPLDVIGNGSFGIIRKVRRKTDGLIFARKELIFERMSERDRKQIVAEVNILKDLHHEHIVGYHDRFVDRDAGILYILMEYCGGGDLSSVIKQASKTSRPISEDTIWNYFMQILLALHHCHHPHGHGRSSSGSGASLTEGDGAGGGLGDFGLSKALAQASFANTYVGLTRQTPYYMSPELMQEKAYDSKSDIWSLGCLIYELCALKPPFHEAKTHSELSILIRNGRIPPLPRGYSQSLFGVIKAMLNLNPAMPPSAAQLLQHERLELVFRVSETEKISCTLLLYTHPGALARSVYGPVRHPFWECGWVWFWFYSLFVEWTDGRVDLGGRTFGTGCPTLFLPSNSSRYAQLFYRSVAYGRLSRVSLRGKDFDGMLGIWMWTNAFVCRVG
ncbi:kinase-like domain-containing protein [Ephemerocybe angulata]|uniref:non-specific serine/threonine protein kinase n=1 Tax=Ephemerocybe angulata TaxID=980116 RepID=A0A8H6HKP8_9AGAR|nr:kinase-like domain-containing protein [Tulosesus angulatus]